MGSHITLKHQSHGSNSTLYLTFSSKEGAEGKGITDPISINNLALVRFKFRHIKYYGIGMGYTLKSSIMLKKDEKAKSTIIKMNLTCGKFQNRLICPDDWVEIELMEIPLDYWNNVENLFVSSLEVNITVQEIKTVQNSKLYDDTDLTDFHLRTTDGAVAVHKAILAMHSDMFMTMFSGEWKETVEGNITIAGVTAQTLRDLKQYIYLGILPDEGLELLLQIAARYLMEKLKADCIAKLIETVEAKSLHRLIEIACQYNIPELVTAILFHTTSNHK